MSGCNVGGFVRAGDREPLDHRRETRAEIVLPPNVVLSAGLPVRGRLEVSRNHTTYGMRKDP